MKLLGLDIGSNSVGSAWVDTAIQEICMGVSVFPAGVDEQENKRGAPKNQARRQTRSQRRTIHRRAERKRKLVRFLMEKSLVPREPGELRKLFDFDPWLLRRKSLCEPLSPHEFGRVVIHLAQRRGAVGVVTDPDDPDEGKVKEGMDRLGNLMQEQGAETVGQLLANLIDERKLKYCLLATREEKSYLDPIRNRQYRIREEDMLFAGRPLVSAEFHRIVKAQRCFEETHVRIGIIRSPLSTMLTKELLEKLDDPRQTNTWRHQGLLFGQRRTYWDAGTLGRCVLEPAERCAPQADRHASYYRVVETVNNILIEEGGRIPRPLTPEERQKVIRKLRGPLFKKSKGKLLPKSSASFTDIKEALGIKPRDKSVSLNIEADEDRDINADWFHREIVHGAFTEERWRTMGERQRESVNRAVLKFNPEHEEDAKKLRNGAMSWWGLTDAAADRLIEAWIARPKLERRLNLSRKAIMNLLPRMEEFDRESGRWPTQQEARKNYAKLLDALYQKTGVVADRIASERYATGALGLTAADRYYMRLKKHQIAEGVPELPPAPTLSNPVVRKAIHEVRRHLLAYLRKFRCKPHRVVIELARITKQSERQRNAALARNSRRDKLRKIIIAKILPTAFEDARRLTLNQQRAAVDRVVLAQQQGRICPYCGNAGITDKIAAKGDDLEIDHIVPYSRCGDDGLNNKVLVHRTCNRGKGSLTPREWWGDGFEARIRFAEKLFKNAEPGKGEYFEKRDYNRKWENFNREVRGGDEFKNSQLTDTAYAARQVANYLADALYDGRGLPERGDGEGNQRIFFTMGRLTSMLRKDWQLFETVKPEGEARERTGGMTAEEELELAEKNRGDHRQHAIDAVTIALTDPRIKNKLARWAGDAAEYKEKHGQWPRRKKEDPPWGTVGNFRLQVLEKVYAELGSKPSAGASTREDGSGLIVVSHRPVKRRLTGAFHEDTHYGPVIGPLPPHRSESVDTLFTNRISADRLTPNHLRVPDGWDNLSVKLDDGGISVADKKATRRTLAAMEDPSPGKSGIVRDRALRDRIRKCLRENGLDPENFTTAGIKKLIADKKLTMASRVPIKGVVLLRTNTDPVSIPRKRWDPFSDRMIADQDPRTARVYIGGNNHHVPIREHRKSGKWSGEVVSTFVAAKRVRVEKRDAVDRSDDKDSFVMSLAEGEMVYARRKDRPEDSPNYFVVCKLDKAGNSCRIHFAPHWDARKASEQDRWDVTPGDLKDCGPTLGHPPYKVRVSPLGKPAPLHND